MEHGSKVAIGILLGAGPPIGTQRKKELATLLQTVFDDTELTLSNDIADLARRITVLLENSPLTNAGYGSELTIEGEVECDASMLLLRNGLKRVASVGALKEIRNPINLCHALLSSYHKLPSGRATPNFMVGPGATKMGIEKFGLETADLKTPRAQKTLERYSDTVGVIVINRQDVCVCSSSGGPVLKDSGRIGPAAVPGAGAHVSSDRRAAVCSGFGEDITAFQLAQRALDETDLVKSMSETIAIQETQPYFGFLKAEPAEDEQPGVVFEWQNTTESMVGAVGILGGKMHLINSHQPFSSGGLFISFT